MSRNFRALVDYVDDRFARPFEWGAQANDCISYAAGGVLALTGRDIISELGRNWTSKAGAARVLRVVGGVAAAADLALARAVPAQALRGDIAFVDLDGRQSLMIVEGETLVGPGLRGSVRVPRARALIAWSAE